MEVKGLTMDIAGHPVFDTTTESLCAILLNKLRDSRQCVLLFANSNFIVQCQDYIEWLRSYPVLMVNDGIAMDIAARIVHGKNARSL